MAFSGFSDSAPAALPFAGDAAQPSEPGAAGEMILPNTLAGFKKTPRGFFEFVAGLGADDDTEVETFLGLATSDMKDALDNAVLDGCTLPPIVKAGIAVFVRKIFRAAGFNERALGGSTPAAPAQPQPAFPPVPANVAPPPAAAQQPEQDTIALSGVVDQTSRLTTRLMSFQDLFKIREHYVTTCGRAPPDAHLPTAEQLSCLRALVQAGKVPYVDFAVWNAHGARLKHFARAEAAVFINGAFVSRTLEAPTSVEAWEQSWALFSVAMVSLNEASPGTMAMYADGLRTLLSLFPSRWDALLATDIIVRTERWSRLREQFELSPPPGFSSEAPWDAVIAASAFNHAGPLAAWWQTHFVLPATIASSSASLTSLVDRVDSNISGKRGGRQAGRARRQEAPHRNSSTASQRRQEAHQRSVRDLEFEERPLREGRPLPVPQEARLLCMRRAAPRH